MLDKLVGIRSGSKNGESNSGEPRVNFNEQQNRRKTYGSTRGRCNSSSYVAGDNRTRGPYIRGSSTGTRQTSNKRPTQDTYATGRCDSRNRSQASQGRNNPSELDRRDNPVPLSGGNDAQAGHARNATSKATAIEPLNRSLETFLTRLPRTNERSEKSRKVFKKARYYTDESDGCIDTWIEVLKLHFEEEDLSERQECRALTSNLEGTAVDLMRFEKRRRREDETIEKFLDNLEMLRRRSQPNESNRRMNLAVASKIIDGVKNDELRTMSATHYTLLSTNAPTPKELRLKSKKYLLLEPHGDLYITRTIKAISTTDQQTKEATGTNRRTIWTRNALLQNHVSACPNYKQGMREKGFSLEDENASEVDHEDFMRGVIAKFGSRCFFCNLEGRFKSDCPPFRDAVADIKHPMHEEALSGVKSSKARLLSEAEACRKEKPQELATKKMRAVTEEICEPEPVTAADDFKIDYRAATRDALNRVQ